MLKPQLSDCQRKQQTDIHVIVINIVLFKFKGVGVPLGYTHTPFFAFEALTYNIFKSFVSFQPSDWLSHCKFLAMTQGNLNPQRIKVSHRPSNLQNNA